MLRISGEVLRYINKSDEGWLIEAAKNGYDCAICDQSAQLNKTDPASVLVDVDSNDLGRWVLRFAHAACSPPRVRLVDDFDTGAAPPWAWPAIAIIRTAPAEPLALLLISPNPARPHVEEVGNGDTIDRYTSDLLRQGFDLVLHPRDRLPPVDGVTVDIGPSDLVYVTDANGGQLWYGRLIQPVGWIRLVVTTRQLGVVVAFGPDLDEPYADHEAAFVLAIHDGAAVGATATLHEWRT